MRSPSIVALTTILTALVASCREGGESDDGNDEAAELPSPYDDESGGDDAMPSLDAAQVGAAAIAGLREFAALQPRAVTDAYVAIAMYEEGCPEEFEEYSEAGTTVQVWYSEGCTTSTGISFAGGGRFETFMTTEDGYTAEGATVNSEGASFSIASSDGRAFMMNGYVGWSRGTGEDYTDASIEILGRATTDATTANGNRMLDGSISATGYMFSYADADVKALGGEGAWSGAGLGDARAFAFAGASVYSVGCAAEPAGTLSLRDDAGFWHDVVFDGITTTDDGPEFHPEACDGCGTYLAAGEASGEACVAQSDIEAMLGWEMFAW
jgi:hypothetical protein